MKFDFVFDVQQAFRRILHAFSYPGEIVTLRNEAAHLEISMDCFDATQILMYTLLDTETSVHVRAKNPSVEKRFAQLTSCRLQKIDKAQFLFVLHSSSDAFVDVLQQASCGTLHDPQKGATIIVECDAILDETMYLLKGPGIRESNTLALKGLDSKWLTIRNQCCEEYPLGVDLIFVDSQANCVVLPRTTRITG